MRIASAGMLLFVVGMTMVNTLEARRLWDLLERIAVLDSQTEMDTRRQQVSPDDCICAVAVNGMEKCFGDGCKEGVSKRSAASRANSGGCYHHGQWYDYGIIESSGESCWVLKCLENGRIALDGSACDNRAPVIPNQPNLPGSSGRK